MMSEGMELTRGTKKIIQEAIATVDEEFKHDRLMLCEAFCSIVEQRFTGGAMSYQLKRMGNTYPFDLLSENGWSLQDAIDNDLVVFLSNDWFTSKTYVINEAGDILQSETKQYTSIDQRQATLRHAISTLAAMPIVTDSDIQEAGLREVLSEDIAKSMTVDIVVSSPVDSVRAETLEEKIFWLTGVVNNYSKDGAPIYYTDEEALNFTKAQAKVKGMSLSKENAVKIPLKSTAPILEAIDKYLYDKTGQYTM